MRGLAGWVSPEMMRTLAWTLLHFLWQGAALAAFLAAILAFVRRADKRYALSVVALALMIAAPTVTFALLWKSAPVMSSAATQTKAAALAVSASHRMASGFPSLAAVPPQTAPPDVLFWFVQVWFAGVLLLSLRTAGGFILVEHLRRREVNDVSDALRQRCLALQRRLGIDRVIRYCECLRLDAPAVIGWFRPVVLLPVMALTGLSEAQLEIVIAHELAHIQRFDSFANLFQVVAETLLFYHPAVWWVNRRIRVERENCCDDLAVAACGNAVEYARALAAMEEWRATPVLAMGANRGSLTARVGRLLGVGTLGSRVRGAGLAVGLLCTVGALVAGNALLGYERVILSPNAAPIHSIAATGPVVLEVHPFAKEAHGIIGPMTPSIARETTATPVPRGQEQKPAPSANAEEPRGKQSYIDQMEAAGFKNLSADDLIALKVQGVTPDYIRAMRDLGFNVTVDEIVGMKVQGVTPEYVRAMRDLGFKPSADDIIGMKTMGVTEEYVRGMRAVGISPDADEIVGMKAQGVTPEYVKEMQALGLKPTADDVTGMKTMGVTPEYIREMRALGLEVNADDVTGLKAQGVTPEYVKMLQAAGLGKVTTDDVTAAKAQGISAEFIEQVKKHGFKNLDLEKLIALKNAGVF
jgi:beta-lactamase regulating signal transducer with metallopeptidase domain